MAVQIIAEQLLILLFIIFLGILLTRLRIINEAFAKALSGITTKVMIPAMVICSMQRPFSTGDAYSLGVAAISFVVMLVTSIVPALIICKMIRAEKSEVGIWLCCCAFGNFLLIGKPLTDALYGNPSVHIIITLAIVYNIFCFSLGVFFIQLGQPRTGSGIKGFCKAAFNPMIVGSAIGMFLYLSNISLPRPINSALNHLSSMLMPSSMLVIGYSLYGLRWKSLICDWRIYAISIIRLMICPILTYYMVRLISNDPVVMSVIAIGAATPIGATIGVLSNQYGNAHNDLCAKALLFSTVACVVTIPLIVAILPL